MFCQHCGEKLPDNSAFCPACGKSADGTKETESDRKPADFGITPGFSEKINDPSIRAALKKGKKFTAIFAVILVLAPIFVTLYLSIKDNDFKNLGYGAVISLVFLVFALFSALKRRTGKQWDGTVTDKYTKIRTQTDDDGFTTSQTVYITKFKKEKGGSKKLEESEINHTFFDYLNIGDKVRFHPQFNCYYEKFDKSRDSYSICPICNSRISISEDTCTRCKIPVIK